MHLNRNVFKIRIFFPCLIRHSGCCWISLSRYGGGWLVSTSVNLNRRSDNGRVNSSPISRSAAIVRLREGCPQSLRIPVEDPDGDVVKCRYSTYSESRLYDDSFPYGVLDEVNKFTVGFLQTLDSDHGKNVLCTGLVRHLEEQECCCDHLQSVISFDLNKPVLTT